MQTLENFIKNNGLLLIYEEGRKTKITFYDGMTASASKSEWSCMIQDPSPDGSEIKVDQFGNGNQLRLCDVAPHWAETKEDARADMIKAIKGGTFYLAQRGIGRALSVPADLK